MTELPRLMSAKDLREYFNLSLPAVYRLASTENFPRPIMIGKRRRVWTVESILEWTKRAA